MNPSATVLPDLQTLRMRLSDIFLGDGSAVAQVKILSRKRPAMTSTFLNEIVDCRLRDGSAKRLFIKYQINDAHDAFGHRGGVGYEAEVYRRVLEPLKVRPRYFGSYTSRRRGESWLILEYIPRAVRVSDIVRSFARQPMALTEAASWIAQFHAAHEQKARNGMAEFLKRYDADYYRGWAARTLEFSRSLRRRFPWLAHLERGGGRWFAPLLEPPWTIIHGEFYAKTLLLQRRKLF